MLSSNRHPNFLSQRILNYFISWVKHSVYDLMSWYRIIKWWANVLIFDNIDCQNEFISKSQISMNSCWAVLHELQCKQWLDEMTRKPKLRIYVIFKNSYEVEPYALSFLNRKHWSYLAQCHWGILPLSIETSRWGSIPLEDRICKMCVIVW